MEERGREGKGGKRGERRDGEMRREEKKEGGEG